MSLIESGTIGWVVFTGGQNPCVKRQRSMCCSLFLPQNEAGLALATVLLAIYTSLVNAASRISCVPSILHASSPFSSDFYCAPIQRVI